MMSAGSCGGLARAVPVGIEPVAHELLVETCLALSRLIGILRPEARGVRREHLISQGERAIDRAEFELGIGDDDAMLGGVISCLLVDGKRCVAQSARILLVKHLDRALIAHVLVMIANLGLGRRRVDGLGQLLASMRPSGSSIPQTVPCLRYSLRPLPAR